MKGDVDDLCRKLLPVLGDPVRRLWALHKAGDADGRRWVELELARLAERHLGLTFENKPALLEPPPADVCAGDYPLGTVTYDGKDRWPFGLREDEWVQHTGIFGRSGCGKTNTVFLIVRALAQHGTPFLLFDWKRNYRDLLATPEGKGLLVFTVGRADSAFFFNPLIPPSGTPVQVWMKKAIDVAAHAFFLGEGVKYLLQEALDAVYRDYDAFGGEPERWPNMADVLAHIKRMRVSGRQADWLASTQRAAAVLSYGEVGRVLNCREPFPLAELLKRNVLLELDALTSSDKTFFIEALLLWVHHYRMAEAGPREEFKHAVIIEEAHHILLKSKQQMDGGETITDVILREIRELGEAVILIDQHPSLISKPALGNTAATIAMNMKHADDTEAAAKAMGLWGDDRKALNEIPVGSAVVRLQGRWPRPFMVRFPHAGVKKGAVTDDDVRRHMDKLVLERPAGVLESRLLVERIRECTSLLDEAAGLLVGECPRPGLSPPLPNLKGSPPAPRRPRLSSRPPPGTSQGAPPPAARPRPGPPAPEEPGCSAREASSGLLRSAREVLRALPPGEKKGQKSVGAEAGLEPDEWLLLRDVAERPVDGTFERYRRLGVSSYRCNKARTSLVDRGLLQVVEVRRRDGRVKLLEPTTAGRELLKARGLTYSWRHGGALHQYWVHHVAGELRRQGWTVEVEKPIGGGATVDVAAEKDGERVAYEVETGKSEAAHNVKRALAAGFDRVVVLGTDEEVTEWLRRGLAGVPAAGAVDVEQVSEWHLGGK